MAEKFVKAVAKPSRPDMNPIRYVLIYLQFMCLDLKSRGNRQREKSKSDAGSTLGLKDNYKFSDNNNVKLYCR